MSSIRRDIRLLKGYAALITLGMAVLSVAAFRQGPEKVRFTELDVERINVIEPDGKLRMVLANRPRSIGPIYRGIPFGYPGGSRPGIIFFNDEGTENGGLTFTGGRREDGSYAASTGMSFDQFNQDEVLTLRYSDRNGRRTTGITIADRAPVDIFDLVQERDSLNRLPDGPEKAAALERWAAPRDGVPLRATRVYLGRNLSKTAILTLSDPEGRPRIRLQVDSLGTPSLEFLDRNGLVTSRIPEG